LLSATSQHSTATNNNGHAIINDPNKSAKTVPTNATTPAPTKPIVTKATTVTTATIAAKAPTNSSPAQLISAIHNGNYQESTCINAIKSVNNNK